MKPKIEFVREERKCPWNDRVNSGERCGKLIYDHAVFIDGERRAEFVSWAGRHRHDLRTAEGKNSRLIDTCDRRGEFLRLVQTALGAGKIPTLAQYAERAAEIATQATRAKVEAENVQRIERVRDAAPSLLNALKLLLADIEDYQRVNHLGGENNQAQVLARSAIAEAETIP